LPVFNRRAIELAVSAALALESKVQEQSRFDRKNYYYPDLPKAYQISQYDRPLAVGGGLDVDFPAGPRRISLERVHLEEEAGKLLHIGDSIFKASYTLVDYNRAGIPLLEIVTAPDLRSGQEARLFLEALRTLLLYIGVSDVKMEQGSLRCDANISLRPVGSKELGIKTEVKNLNSFRFVEQAINCEEQRQAEILRRGEKVVQQTCHWDEVQKVTAPLRGKEGSSDYRYFPEPDLLPLHLERLFVERLQAALPELPRRRYYRLQQQYNLEPREAALLTAVPELSCFFEAAAKDYQSYRNLANWVQGDLCFHLRETGQHIGAVNPRLLAELLGLIDSGEISRTTAKDLLPEMLKTGTAPRDLAKERDLGRIFGHGALDPVVSRVLMENDDAVESFRKGRQKALAYLVGQVMMLTGGRADPGEVNALLRKKMGTSD
jgi:aspartyl-tRNA(Asn)/glutamyl-tRNA(Gln) amidotransferase subunit B